MDLRSGATVTFQVSDLGTVSYNSSFEETLTGAGTSTLTVNGRTVTVDTTALTVPQMVLDNTVVASNSAPAVFTGLPGTYALVDPTSGKTIQFIINLDGTIDYDHALDNILSGRGTATLVVRGLPG
jgi:hypothetical protein